MILSRLFFVLFGNLAIHLAHISPNHGNELDSDDKPYDGGTVKNYFRKFVFLLILIQTMSFTHLAYHSDTPLSTVEIILAIMMVVSFLLRMWSYLALSKFFTFTLAIKKNHQLVTTGPYRYLVHPSYTGQLLLLFAFVIFTRWYYLVPIMGFYTYKTLMGRIKIEEEMMRGEFGREYDEYVKARWRVIPFIY